MTEDARARTHPPVIVIMGVSGCGRSTVACPNVVVVHLAGSTDIVEQRLTARLNHFMPGSLLASQIATLQPPQADENAVTIRSGSAWADDAAAIIRLLDLSPASRTVAHTPGEPAANAGGLTVGRGEK
jgi:gluconokinase